MTLLCVGTYVMELDKKTNDTTSLAASCRRRHMDSPGVEFCVPLKMHIA